MESIKKIIQFLNPAEKRRCAWILFTALLFSVFESFSLALLVPYIAILNKEPHISEKALSFFAQVGLPQEENRLILYASVFFLTSITIKSVLHIYSAYLTTQLPYHFFQDKARTLFQMYLRQNYLKFTGQDSSTLLKFCMQTSLYAATVLLYFLQFISYSLIIVFLFGLLVWHDPFSSTILMALLGSVGFGVYQAYKKPQKQAGIEREEASKEAYKDLTEAFLTFKELRIYDKEHFFVDKFRHSLDRLGDGLHKAAYYPVIPVVLIEYVAIALLLGIVMFFFADGEISTAFVSSLVLFAAVLRRLLPTINQLSTVGINLHQFLHSFLLFDEEYRSLEGVTKNTVTQRAFEKEIRCEDVVFSYDGKAAVLKGVTFTIPKNRSIAFVGFSGAGKSTIIDLLVSLLEPQAGRFFIDDAPVRDLSSIQSHIGYVPQSIALLNDTIAQNIAFGERAIDHERLGHVLQMAHLAEFVENLPDKTETIVGERGVKLSGGQKQRLGIARALYRDPDIVIFDEATSSLDSVSEAIIAQSISEMARKKTIVAIAHRLSTVQGFDTIYVLDKGHLVSSGTHEELLEKCPRYQELSLPQRKAECVS